MTWQGSIHVKPADVLFRFLQSERFSSKAQVFVPYPLAYMDHVCHILSLSSVIVFVDVIQWLQIIASFVSDAVMLMMTGSCHVISFSCHATRA